MISSVFSLKEANSIPDYLIPTSETKLEENYYFNSSLDFLLECHDELLSYRRDFYRTVLEAGENSYIINESFEDVIQKIKDIIKKVLAYIESIFRRFVTSLNKFVSSDKYLAKMKKEIHKFPSDESFNMTGYHFTFRDHVPSTNVTGLTMDHLNSVLARVTKDGTKTPKEIEAELASLTAELVPFTGEDALETARMQILGLTRKVPESSFANEIFAVFRDGSSEEGSITIDKSEVNRALKDYDEYKEKIKQVTRLKKELDATYKRLETEVDNAIKNNINNSINTGANVAGSAKDSILNTLNALIAEHVNTISKISNYHLLAFSGKIDAYNAATVQDKNILYRALSVVQKDIKNMKVMEGYDYTSYDYTREGRYKDYLIERYIMNMNQQTFVEECLALSESNIPELKVIQEDLKMNAKNLFERLKELFRSLYQKFLMKMNKFIIGDKEFLTKYKDIILTKKVDEFTLNDMPDYQAGIKNIKDHKLQKIDISTIVSETEEGIRSKILPAYKGGEDFTEFAKKYFLSNNTEPKDVKSTEIKMAEIYAFCIQAKDAIKVLESDQQTFTTAADNAKNAVINAINKVNTEAYDEFGEKFYYSTVLESYITEGKFNTSGKSTVGETIKTAKNQNNSQQSSPTITKNDSNGDAVNTDKSNSNLKLDPEKTSEEPKENKNLKDDVKSDETQGKSDEEQAKENQNAESKKVEETAKWYLSALSTVCRAKITAFQKIYKEYMKILRYHVAQATGSMGTTAKFTEDDRKEIKEIIKSYRDAENDEGKNNAIDRLKSVYKTRQMVIDNHDAKNIIEKNLKANLD